MSLSSVVTMGYLPDSGASLPLIVLMGYSNGAEEPQPPPEISIPHFGGGPFTRRYQYGYDDEDEEICEEIREAAVEALEPVSVPAEIPQAKREFELEIDTLRVERVAKETVRRIWQEEVAKRKLELEREEAIAMLLVLM